MTRIIAIVVVIAAAVVAYMYTSAGDVEVGEVPSASQPTGETAVDSAAVPGDEAAVTNPAQAVLVDPSDEEEAVTTMAGATDEEAVATDAPIAELAEEAVEEELIEGELDASEVDLATEAEVLDDTAESVPAEEGLSDEEPDAGVGAVSTEEETDGAGIEGIVAEEGEQQGLAGEMPAEDANVPAIATEEAGDPSQTPEGLDTSVDNAPEAVLPGDENAVESAVAGAASEESQTEAVGPAVTQDAAPAATALPDPGLAVAVPATAGTADLDALLDPATLDVAAVTEAIEASDLEPAEQTQLVEALETAQGSPDLLPAVLDRIRTALSGE